MRAEGLTWAASLQDSWLDPLVVLVPPHQLLQTCPPHALLTHSSNEYINDVYCPEVNILYNPYTISHRCSQLPMSWQELNHTKSPCGQLVYAAHACEKQPSSKTAWQNIVYDKTNHSAERPAEAAV